MNPSSGNNGKQALAFQFRSFEANFETGELRKNGVLIRIPPQPFQVLAMLLEQPGELVTREQIQQELWGDNVSVEFDAGLNRCIRQLRAILSDEAEAPRYIETVPRKGYRFIAAVSRNSEGTDLPEENASEEVLARGVALAGKPLPSNLPATESAVRTRGLFPWSPAVIVSLILGVVVVYLALPRVIVHPVKFDLDAVPLANDLGDQYSPTFSPDGRDAAYSWNGSSPDVFSIYRKQVNSPNALRLTFGTTVDYSPTWSPDGNWIAFCRGKSQPGGAVWIIPALGGSERKLVDLKATAWPISRVLAWSADSKWLVVSERLASHPYQGLSLINVQSGDTSQLTHPGASQDDISPAISPDGQTLAFTRDRGDGVSSIELLPFTPYSSPSKQIRSLAWPGFESVVSVRPAWTPDGKQIIFESNKGGQSHLFAALASGSGEPVDLAALGDHVSSPALSARGQLAYVHQLENINIWKINTHATDRGHQLTRLIASTRIINTPAVSPDGTRVAFASNQYGEGEIWTSKVDGTEPTQLTFLNSPGTGSPAWSPDGSKIVFDARHEGQPRLYIVSSGGGTPHKIAARGNSFVPSWSPDGRWIYYSSDASGRSEIWRIPPAGGEAEQVTKEGGFAPVLSPDGKLLYYTQARTPIAGLWRLSLETRQNKLLAADVIRRAYAAARDGIYFAAGSPFGPQELFFLGREASQPNSVLKLDKRIEESISLAPDGSALYVAQVEHRSFDLMIAKNFWRK